MPDQQFDKMTDFDMMVVDVTLPAEDAVERVSQLKQYLGDKTRQSSCLYLVAVQQR